MIQKCIPGIALGSERVNDPERNIADGRLRAT